VGVKRIAVVVTSTTTLTAIIAIITPSQHPQHIILYL